MLVVPRALHGVVPDVVGLNVRKAMSRLEQANLTPLVSRFADGKPGRVVAQRPAGGVAASENMTVRLVVGRRV